MSKFIVMTPGGHAFLATPDDEIEVDWFDEHEWVTCAACEENDCMNCSPEILYESCPMSETLPGLGWDEFSE